MTEERRALERLLARLTAGVLGVAVLVLVLPTAWSFTSPFVIAVALAAAMRPIVGFFEKKLKLPKSLAVLVPLVIVCAVALLLIYWVISFGVSQLLAVGGNSGQIIGEGIAVLRAALEKLLGSAARLPDATADMLRNAANSGLTWLTEQTTSLVTAAVTQTVALASGIPYALIYANFLILDMYFVSVNYDGIRAKLPGGSQHNPDSNTSRLTNTALTGLVGYLKVQGTYAGLTLAVSWLVLTIFGYEYAFLIAVAAAILEFLPLFGNGLLYVPWAIVLLILGDVPRAVMLLCITYGLLFIRRMTEPKLLSHNIGISPLLSLIGMFAGVRAGGILGLILGPVVMVVVVSVFHGPYFDGIRKDAGVIARYLRRRWTDPKRVEASTEKTTGQPTGASSREENKA